jgi:hypothetical protein
MTDIVRGNAFNVPYTIWAPPYTHRSGGVRALYQLCAMLRAEGERAAIQMCDNRQPYHGPWIAPPYDASPIDGTPDGRIVVYPEIIVGNPAGAARYCRWILAPVERDGLCFQWLPSMGDRPVLHVPIIEPDLFFPRSGRRAGLAYWVGKATLEHRAAFLPVDVDEIHRDAPPTRAGLADRLGGLEMLVSLDAFSAINVEAAICGTPVRVFSEQGVPRNSADDRYVSFAGVAFDDEPWELASSTVTDAYPRYVDAYPAKVESVREFIRISQERA